MRRTLQSPEAATSISQGRFAHSIGLFFFFFFFPPHLAGRVSCYRVLPAKPRLLQPREKFSPSW